MDGPIFITFGVELEFYIRFKASDYEVAMAEIRDRWQWITYEVQMGMAVQSHMINALEKNHIAVNAFAAKEETYSKWTVAGDPTIQPAIDNPEYGNPEFSFEGIELKSPALPYSSRSVEHIALVISIIKETFKTCVNRSTGLHVHVGSSLSAADSHGLPLGSRTAGFPLQTLKNFASLVTVFQRQIQSIHAEERLHNRYCAPPSTVFRQQPPLQIAKHIHSISTLRDLLDIFTTWGNRYQAYNFENLRERLKTIEFRQHKGTMDSDEIGHYIHLVCGLICASHLAGPAGFTDLIIRYASNPDIEHYSFLDLLADLELDRLIPYYSTRLRTHRRLSHEWHPGLKSPTTSANDLENDGVITIAWTPHDELRAQDPPQTASNSRESEPPHGQPWVANYENLQDHEEHSEELEATPRQLRIANPNNISDSDSDEDEGPIVEPAEWSDFAWDWREEAWERESGSRQPGYYIGEPDALDPLLHTQEGATPTEPEARPRLRISNPDEDAHSPETEARPRLRISNPDEDADSP